MRGYAVEDRGYRSRCWIWQGALSAAGYGYLRVGGILYRAHRYFYELEHGPIPEGKELDHLCEVRDCVRPSHLEPVTRAENLQRGRGSKLTPADVAAIRVARAAGARTADLAARYAVWPSTIYRAACGETWA